MCYKTGLNDEQASVVMSRWFPACQNTFLILLGKQVTLYKTGIVCVMEFKSDKVFYIVIYHGILVLSCKNTRLKCYSNKAVNKASFVNK